jgi:hypothetical protein
MGNPGIYIATSKENPDRFFIFSAMDGTEVWNMHYEAAMKGKHPVKRLQDHFKKNPSDLFDVKLLFGCEKNEMFHYTNHFIDQMKPYFNQKTKAKK